MSAAYLTAVEAAAHMKFPNVAAFRAFLYRRRKAGRPITTHRRNGTLLFRPADLDAALTVERSRPRKAVA